MTGRPMTNADAIARAMWVMLAVFGPGMVVLGVLGGGR